MPADKYKFNPLSKSGFDLVRDLSLYATIEYVNSQILGENLWDRTINTLTTHNSGDNVAIYGNIESHSNIKLTMGKKLIFDSP